MKRTEVLDRVGGLLLLPNTVLATTKQVAEIYGVPLQTIHSVVRENKDEFESEGYKLMEAVSLVDKIDT